MHLAPITIHIKSMWIKLRVHHRTVYSEWTICCNYYIHLSAISRPKQIEVVIHHSCNHEPPAAIKIHDVIKCKLFPCNWLFVRWILPVTGWISLTKDQECGLWCFFDVGLHELLNIQSNDRWFETTWCSCDVIVMLSQTLYVLQSRKCWCCNTLWIDHIQQKSCWRGVVPFLRCVVNFGYLQLFDWHAFTYICITWNIFE